MVEEEATGTPPKVGHSKTNLCKTLHTSQENVDFSHIKSIGSSHVCVR